jgi:hypothetical protein
MNKRRNKLVTLGSVHVGAKFIYRTAELLGECCRKSGRSPSGLREELAADPHENRQPRVRAVAVGVILSP